ncbi:MAG: right-handed parallel beta-helix repeat-containing protein, partial [Planctomycetales bacterium]|nr:right-handed parallel beta-helix repeat-containing protein [Planctomycetales bacterium]
MIRYGYGKRNRTLRPTVERLENRRLLTCSVRRIPYLETFDQISGLPETQWTASDPAQASVSLQQMIIDAPASSAASATLRLNLPPRRFDKPLDMSFLAKPIGSTDGSQLVIEISELGNDWTEIDTISGVLDEFGFYAYNLKRTMEDVGINGEELFLRLRQVNDGPATNKFAIDDVEITDGSVRFDAVFEKTTLVEGESTTVTLDRASGSDRLELSLSHVDSRELVIPDTVIFDRDEKTTQFTITATNDGNLDGTTTGILAARGDGVNRLDLCLTVLDDDTPERLTIGGQLQGVLTPHSYDVVSSVNVNAGDTLEIQSGAELRFAANTGLSVAGTLLANGSEKDIVFTSQQQNPSPGDWDGISVSANNMPRTVIDNAVVEYARTGVSVSPIGNLPAATIVNSVARENSAYGISVSTTGRDSISAADVVISSNRITSNQNGILLAATAGPGTCRGSKNASTVADNLIYGNAQSGIRLTAAGVSGRICVLTAGPGHVNATLTSNVIANNGADGILATSYDGANANGLMTPSLVGNYIVNNVGDGISFNEEAGSTSNVLLESNTIGGNQGVGISYDGTAVIINNLVTDNAQGIVSRQDTVINSTNNLVMGNAGENWVGFPRDFGIRAGDPVSGVSTDRHGNVLEDPAVIGNGDYHLRFDSPAIGRSTPTANTLNVDIDQQSRGGQRDIGADEYVAAIPNEWANNAYIASRSDETVESIANSPGNSIVVVGTRGFLDGGGSDIETILQKVDANGDQIWEKAIAANGAVVGKFVATNQFGDIFVAGEFNGDVDFDFVREYPDRRDRLSSGGKTNVFVAKYDTDGRFVWTKELASRSAIPTRVYAFALHGQGDVVLGGAFGGTADFDPLLNFEELVGSSGATDAYVWSLTGDGNYNWAWTAGGATD